MRGRTSVDYTDTGFQNVYRTGQNNLSNAQVKWAANGYRFASRPKRNGKKRLGAGWPAITFLGQAWVARFKAISVETKPIILKATIHFVMAVPPTPVGYYNGSQTPGGPDMANGYGLYDMAGNVWEWVWDWHDSGWYARNEARINDTRGPAGSSDRVIRGGSWVYSADDCRAAYRNNNATSGRNTDFGFRLALAC